MGQAVGIIGIGSIGYGVAQSLLREGYSVFACENRPEVLAKFVEQGGLACKTPRELGEYCDIVICLVVNAEQTDSVLFGDDGATKSMRDGGVVIASATVMPSYAEDLGRRLAERGLQMIDAPVSGGSGRAASGELTIISSGPDVAYERVDAILTAISSKVYRLGTNHGAGSKMKLINQLLTGTHIATAAEAMAFALRENLDPIMAYEIITHSAGNSWMFENHVPHILAGDYTPTAAVDIFVKDLGLVLDTAHRSKFPLPMASAAHQLFLRASASGYGREDDSAVIKIYPGIELPEAERP